MGERFVLFFKKGNGTADSGSQRSVATEIWRLIPLKPVVLWCGPQPKGISFSWELVKNANYGARSPDQPSPDL